GPRMGRTAISEAQLPVHLRVVGARLWSKTQPQRVADAPRVSTGRRAAVGAPHTAALRRRWGIQQLGDAPWCRQRTPCPPWQSLPMRRSRGVEALDEYGQ